MDVTAGQGGTVRIARVAAERPARGSVRLPGDKSIGHRALLLGALARGETRIRGLSAGEDNGRTRAALQALGVPLETQGDEVVVGGVEGALRSPDGPLDMGNSGTTTRLLTGILASTPGLVATLIGDASLTRRPHRRIVAPLTQMGAAVSGQGERITLPLVVEGRALRGISYELPVASAQIQSCLLLAGLRASGETAVREPGPCRDHTERMLRWFGWPVRRRAEGWVAVAGGGSGRAPGALEVAGDPSSAAFWLALAAPQEGAEVTVRDVSLNPTRTGFLDVLRRMGARVAVVATGERAGEPVGDVTVQGGPLRAIRDDGADLGRVIDEVPLVALLATRAEGRSRLEGLAELRVKESDRVATTAAALQALGATVSVEGDALVVDGGAGRGARLRGGTVEADGDHRIAMMAAVAAAWGGGEVAIRDVGCVATSYPEFFTELVALSGATVRFAEEPLADRGALRGTE